METHHLITLLSTLSIWCSTPAVSVCPVGYSLSPCSCSEDVVYCGGNQTFNLKSVLDKLNVAKPNDNDRHFKRLYMNNSAITELPSNVFNGAIFDEIVIDNALSLKEIDLYAFVNNNRIIKTFRLLNTPFGGNTTIEDYFFYALSMGNVEELHVENTRITQVAGLYAMKSHEKIIFKNNRQLVTVQPNAFYSIKNLTELTLDGNPIDFIPENFVTLPKTATKTLNITLANTKLTSDSFSPLAFDKVNGRFILNVGFNTGFSYVNQTIFEKILSDGNQINLLGAQLVCDCRMLWLYRNKAYQSLVHNDSCEDGKSIFDSRIVYIRCVGGT